MRRALAVVAYLVLASGFGCESESDGGTHCETSELPAECCSVPDHLPCKGLSLEDCQSRDYCMVVNGTGWNDDHMGPQSFLGCASACGRAFDAIEICLYDPARPADCYWNGGGALPDGWVELQSCAAPPGFCGK